MGQGLRERLGAGVLGITEMCWCGLTNGRANENKGECGTQGREGAVRAVGCFKGGPVGWAP